MKNRCAILSCGLAALLSLPAGAAESTYGANAAGDIVDRIARKDCSGAVEDLKTGLKREFPEVSLVAGTMYEHGVCVKRDWDRAIAYYVQAWQGGAKEAADRLAAGYASPEHGADAAAALWWAGRGRGNAVQATGMPPCTVSAAAADDIDRFVAELQTWQPSRLAACNYMTGVMSTLSAEVKYPALALRYNVNGRLLLRFLPGVPKIEMEKEGSRDPALLGWVEEDAKSDRARTRLAGFDGMVSEVANRALRRYPKPAGIPPDALVTVQYIFDIK